MPEQLLQSLSPARRPGVAHIDLTATTWCDPAGLVALVVFAEAQLRHGRRVEVSRPRNASIANFLARMRLGRVLDTLGCTHDLGSVTETGGLELLEVRRFDGESGAEELAALVHAKTESMPQVARALHTSLGEIGQNVSQHSGSPHGYMAAVTTHGGRRIEFAVADSGSGLTANLRHVGSASDAQSLEMVLHGDGVSSTRQPGRGNGIPDTRRLVTGLDGKVGMFTGNAGHIVWRGTSSSLSGRLPLPGSLFHGSLPCL